ncbi:MAG: efflux RND transporter periplasmic adaptor subunit [Prevotella sp.]|jgi:HlyD family secretion protein|nr:efflux RND transporter periplasmic adaptor subunit [Prevotella sp.]
MKNKKIYIGIAVAVVIVAIAYFLLGGKKSAGVSYSTAEVLVKDITNSVTATGTIEPVTSVTVGTQVSGIVAHLYVDYNSVVKKGQVIAELDKTNLLSELASARANLSSAQSNLSYQKANYNRYKTLYDKGLISANDFEQARLSYEQAQQQVRTSSESVNKAQTNLGYATITSPIDGIVLSKSVEEGQTVAASFSTPELFTIAQDLTNMQVIADIDEADIGEVKEGQRVKFTVDAYPDDTFSGTVTQVRQEATTESNVVTYQVVISAPNVDMKLKPGLTANVTIYTKEVKDVLAVPAKALKFTPNEKMLTKGQTIVDCQGTDKVWVLDGDTFRAYAVTIGITDGILTEIKSGIKAGQQVITEFQMRGASADGGDTSGQSTNNPFMPKRPGSNKKGSGGPSSSSK